MKKIIILIPVFNDWESLIKLINEISEIINVVALNMTSEIKNNNDLKFILNDITEFSKCKPKEHPGISSRTKFKYMDMLEEFK